MITVSNILIDRVRVLLRDTDVGGVQWTDSELIAWFNDACSEIARIRPESSSITADVPTSAGTKQTIPAGGSMLLEVVCNQNGGVRGRAIRRIERQVLDTENPNWHTATPTNEAFRFIPSLTDPRTFYLYPPSIGTANDPTVGITVVYSKSPAPVTGLSDPVPLPDMYAPTIVNYVCFRAFQKMNESEAARLKAAEFYQLFTSQMGQTDGSMEQRNAKVRQPTNALGG